MLFTAMLETPPDTPPDGPLPEPGMPPVPLHEPGPDQAPSERRTVSDRGRMTHEIANGV